MKKLNTEEFIKRSKEIHGDKYDYSKTIYTNSKEKICIICPQHGEFWIRASHHLEGIGCHKCAKESCDNKKRLTKETFISRSKEIHGDKYDYSKVEYINNRKKVCIICPEHGEFWQKPSDHMLGCTCPICANIRISKARSKNTEYFIKKAKEIHGDKYDYSKTIYTGSENKLIIICPKHGEFLQSPSGHISNKEGCPICAHELLGNRLRNTKEYFIEQANKIHNNKYDYSKAEYFNNYNKIIITCKKHGDFLQTPHNHLRGCGCPKCNISKMERMTISFFEKHNIEYEYQKRFKKWLGNMSLDFYLPKYNIAIECQGQQHFEPIIIRGESKKQSEENFKKQCIRDENKKVLCKENGIKLFYINYNENINEKLKIILKENVVEK